MNVKVLANRAGVAPHVVGYYTQRGLLAPRWNARNGYREYVTADLHRLGFICRAKLIGFTLADIHLILRDADAGEAPCPKVRQIVQRHARDHASHLAAAGRLQARRRPIGHLTMRVSAGSSTRWMALMKRARSVSRTARLIQSIPESDLQD